MAFKFRCPMCGKRLAAEESPGSQTMCPHCSQAVTVPADAEAGDADAPLELAGVGAAAATGAGPGPGAAEEQQPEEPPPTGMDNVMGWLALYLPSWGTSFLLHVAVVIMMAFMAWQVEVSQPPPFEYRSAVVPTNIPPPEKKPDAKKDDPKKNQTQSGRGKGRPGPSTILHLETDNPVPDLTDNRTGSRLNVLGVGGGGDKIGGYGGLGTGGARAQFMTINATPDVHKIVYVCDRSGSMTDSMDYLKYEMKRSIGDMDESTEFHVIFFSSGPPQEMPLRKLVPANEAAKNSAFAFIDGIVPMGETDPSKALERAFAVGADLIFLETDGEFDREIVPLIKRLNPQGKVTVHTIGFIYRTGEAVLKDIAAQNNGTYKFVSEQDLAQLSNN
jgi:hypothetical protein